MDRLRIPHGINGRAILGHFSRSYRSREQLSPIRAGYKISCTQGYEKSQRYFSKIGTNQ